MSTALAERPETAPTVTADQMDLIRRTIAKDATPDELKLYLYDCARQGVHPLDKLIHFTARKQKDGTRKYTPITSIDFMRIRAAETGEYAGSEDAIYTYDADGKTLKSATANVYRLVQGQRCLFQATARWSEYKPEMDDFMWRKMPHTMLAKCAEALALRKGFPRQLAGLYAREEMDQAGVETPAVTGSGGTLAPTPTQVVAALPSVPNGGDSGRLNTETGEVLPEPPPGYAYIERYDYKNGWHELVWGTDAQGGHLTWSTKTRAGDIARQAYQDGVPVKLEGRAKPRGKGEFYLNEVHLPEDRDGDDEPPALTDDDIPF